MSNRLHFSGWRPQPPNIRPYGPTSKIDISGYSPTLTKGRHCTCGTCLEFFLESLMPNMCIVTASIQVADIQWSPGMYKTKYQEIVLIQSHTIHVWYIYLHLVVFNGKIW